MFSRIPVVYKHERALRVSGLCLRAGGGLTLERMSDSQRAKSILILILGSMTALSPFSIDMYLPAFQQIAADFGVSVAEISLSISAYFIGIACGQLFYGPLLDRYGRKKPLYVGIGIYLVATLGCIFAHSADVLIAWRFVQALGGCAAGVASMAMVRDLFTMEESARVFSLLVLILGTSPLFAPTIGGFLAAHLGWQAVFVFLALGASALLATVKFYLAESHAPDPTVELRLGPITRGFLEILRDPRFYTYVLSGAVVFAGLFIYLAGSPGIFLEHFGVSTQVYGWIFAIIAGGFVLMSQVNVRLLKRFTNEQLLVRGMATQVVIGWTFLLCVAMGWMGLIGTIAMFFLFMSCLGLTNPNATALALAPFGKNAGRASALMGFLQMSIGAVFSTSVGIFGINRLLPIVLIISTTATLGFLILLWGRVKVRAYAAR